MTQSRSMSVHSSRKKKTQYRTEVSEKNYLEGGGAFSDAIGDFLSGIMDGSSDDKAVKSDKNMKADTKRRERLNRFERDVHTGLKKFTKRVSPSKERIEKAKTGMKNFGKRLSFSKERVEEG